MADQSFKMTMAKSYALAFSETAELYSGEKCLGTQENSLFSLSVQFLNRASFVSEMIDSYDFLQRVGSTLLSVLKLDPIDLSLPIFRHRRYNPILGDLKIIFSIPGTSRRFCESSIHDILGILKIYHGMDLQIRSLNRHVDYESRLWMNAFNLNLSLSSLFEYLTNWFDLPQCSKPKGIIVRCGESASLLTDRTYHVQLPSVLEFLRAISQSLFDFDGINPEQMLSVPVHVPLALGLGLGLSSTSESGAKDTILLPPLPQGFSFHNLLHRFVSHAIRDCTKVKELVETLDKFLEIIAHKENYFDQMTAQSEKSCTLSEVIHAALMPIACSSQIKIGMWRRNGQVYIYSLTPFCINYFM
jgi:hypothetical protein